MKAIMLLIASLAALPAYAVSVTNLDTQTHTLVIAETAGSKVTRTIAPNETTHLPLAKGSIALQSRPEQAMRIDYLDRLVIWPNGHLQVQMRRKMGGDR